MVGFCRPRGYSPPPITPRALYEERNADFSGLRPGRRRPAGFDLISLMPLLLIFVVFYFLLIRPQQKKMKQHRELISALKRGDRVLTAGGIIGSVVKVEDAELLVEIAKDVRVRVARSTISDVLSKPQPAGETATPVAGSQVRAHVAAVRQEVGRARRCCAFPPGRSPWCWASACSAWSTACQTCFRAPRWSACRTGCRTSRSISGSTCRAARICYWRSSSAR